MSVFNFYYRKQEGQELSNFYDCLVEIDGKKYSSGEKAFHGMKYYTLSNLSSGGRRNELYNYSVKFEIGMEFDKLSNNVVKQKGGKKGLFLSDMEQKLWNSKAKDIQYQICKYKYDNCKEVRECLKKTDDKILIHPALRCNDEKLKCMIWNGRAKVINDEIVVIGLNLLGKIWTELRNK